MLNLSVFFSLQIYPKESCSRLTLTVAFEETMAGLEQWGPLGFESDRDRALQIAQRAVTQLGVGNLYN